jgi:hypothetical protein
LMYVGPGHLRPRLCILGFVLDMSRVSRGLGSIFRNVPGRCYLFYKSI